MIYTSIYLLLLLCCIIYSFFTVKLYIRKTKSYFKAVKLAFNNCFKFNFKFLCITSILILIFDYNNGFFQVLGFVLIYAIIFFFINLIVIYTVLFKLLYVIKNKEYLDYIKFYQNITGAYYLLSSYLIANDSTDSLKEYQYKLLELIKLGFKDDFKLMYNKDINNALRNLTIVDRKSTEKYLNELDLFFSHLS